MNTSKAEFLNNIKFIQIKAAISLVSARSSMCQTTYRLKMIFWDCYQINVLNIQSDTVGIQYLLIFADLIQDIPALMKPLKVIYKKQMPTKTRKHAKRTSFNENFKYRSIPINTTSYLTLRYLICDIPHNTILVLSIFPMLQL